MPRIPVRTEPYSSPSRQHRHYKNKRDQVLRSLGKAAYINGSHFAIMWVSARGDVETYGSEALQGRLDDWFVQRGITDEAKELVRAYRNNAASLAYEREDDFKDEDNDLSQPNFMMDDDLESVGKDASASMSRSITSSTPMLGADGDVFTDENDVNRHSFQSTSRKGDATADPSTQRSGGGLFASRRPIAPLDTNIANNSYRSITSAPTTATGATSSTAGINAMPHTATIGETSAGGMMPFPGAFNFDDAALQPFMTPFRSNDLPLPFGGPSSFKTTLSSSAARTAFLELRFSQLQQGMCKIVAKAWIKIIEPKKQSRCPYNKGEEGKPDWWPVGVRHKEPDHLMKPERHSLLLTILRSPRVKVARLQLATAEVVALIKADKVTLLDDVYRIAREEEKLRQQGLDSETPITVDVSTLEGWSEKEQKAVMEDETQSPRDDALDAEGEEDSSATGVARSDLQRPIIKKKKVGELPSSASNLMRGIKRSVSGPVPQKQNLGLGLSLGSSNAHQDVSRRFGNSQHAAQGQTNGSTRRRNANAQTWLMHEATQHGIKRTSVSSHAFASSSGSASATTTSPAFSNNAVPRFDMPAIQMQGEASQLDPQSISLHEQYGLITPLTADTQLGDPSFLLAAKEDANMHGGTNDHGHETRVLHHGYMSAPPIGHAHLFPHTHPSFGADMTQQHLQQQPPQTSQQPQPTYHYDLQYSQHDNQMLAYAQQQHASQQQQQSQSQAPTSQHSTEQQQADQSQDTSGSGGALGLQGMGNVSWNGSSFFDTSFNTSFASSVGPTTPLH